MARILVIDDDLVSRKILSSLLTKQNHQVLQAESSAAAWEQLEEAVAVDLAVIDNQLKGEKGVDFLQRVREDFVFKPMPAIVYSGSADRESVMAYIKLGIQNVLLKPYNADKLREEVEKAMKKPWTAGCFKSVDAVCEQIGISEKEYFEILGDSAESVAEAAEALEPLFEEGRIDDLKERLTAIKGTAVNVGFLRMEELVDAISADLAAGKKEDLAAKLKSVPVLMRLLTSRVPVEK